MLASQNGHTEIVNLLSTEVNLQNKLKWSALMFACEKGHTNVVKVLIEKGANVNLQNIDGSSALMLASRNGHSNVVTLLRDAEVNVQNNNKWSALMFACGKGYGNVVQILIEKGADVNLQNKDGISALMLASRNGHSNIIKLLDAKVNMQSYKKSSALMLACDKGHSDIVRILIEKGADVNLQNKNGLSALMLASQNGHSNIIKLLDAEVNMQNYKKWSALMLACDKGHSDVVQVLIEKGASVHIQDVNGLSPLILASENGHSNVVKILVKNDATIINMQDSDGWSSLMKASHNEHTDVVKLLLEKGAKVNMQDNDGMSALMLACEYDRSIVAENLIERGAEVNMQQNDGWSALMIASQLGCNNIVKTLLKNGATVNMLNNAGRTALIISCGNGRKEVTQILLKYFADASIRGLDGKTALDWSCEKGYAEIADTLLSFIPDSIPSVPSVCELDHLDSSEITGALLENKEEVVTGKLQNSGESNCVNVEEPTNKESDFTGRNQLSLGVLYKELETVTDPIKLGVGLGLPQHRLEIILRNHPQDIERQQFDVFSFIAKNSMTLKVTWEKIADTLEHFIGMGNLAQNIRRKFTSSINKGGVEFSNRKSVSEGLVLFTNKVIGVGAFGIVFKGEFNGLPCVIKVLHAVASEIRTHLPTASHTSEGCSARFRKECEFLESFKHPNIVCHLATREHPNTNQLLLVLELMDCNLQQYFTPQLDTEPVQLDLSVQGSLCRDIASALEYIHSRGVVHRDLCGENILLSCREKLLIAKVCDFGMSRITKSNTHSVSLQVFAHKGFMPPEATDMESSCYNSAFDIYSFGALMVQIVRQLPSIKDRKERKYELELIPKDHPIKKLVSECLAENRDNRPPAAYLKRRLANIGLDY